MSGSFSNTRRKPCSAPSFASEVPGSVTATKCEPSPCSEWKYLNCDIVSIVPPDFDETMNSVVPRSRASRTARISSGCVESSTCRRTAPSPNERRKTSGPRLEPPMPSSTASVMPASRTSAANARRSSASADSRSAMSSQPSRSVSSGVPSGAHRVPSRSQRRRTTCSSAAALSRSSTGVWRPAGSWLSMLMVRRLTRTSTALRRPGSGRKASGAPGRRDLPM